MEIADDEDAPLTQRDWSSLPPDLLNLIARNLLEIRDFIRFRAVCRSWRGSTPASDLPPQFPWILKHRRSNLLFYSVASDKIYTVPAPTALHKKLFGPSNGYLLARLYNRITAPPVASNERRKVTIVDRLTLLNPLNNDEISLPGKENGGSLNWIGPWRGQPGEQLYYFGHNLVTCKLTFCRPGDDEWRKVVIGDYHTRCKLIFNNMVFSAKESAGQIEVMDIDTGTVLYNIPVPPSYGYNLVGPAHLVAVSGDIFRVCERDQRQCLMYVHRLDFGTGSNNGSPCWIKVDDIGDHALFIDTHGCFSLRADQSAGIRANSIYLFKSVYTGKNWEYACEIYMIDVATGTTKARHCCPLREPHSWYVPNLCRFRNE